MYFLLPAGGCGCALQWLSPGVFSWCSCLPPWYCHTVLSPEPLTTRGDRRRPQQVAATTYSTLCKVNRATVTAGTVEGTGAPELPKLGCSPTDPYTLCLDLRMMGRAWRA